MKIQKITWCKDEGLYKKGSKKLIKVGKYLLKLVAIKQDENEEMTEDLWNTFEGDDDLEFESPDNVTEIDNEFSQKLEEYLNNGNDGINQNETNEEQPDVQCVDDPVVNDDHTYDDDDGGDYDDDDGDSDDDDDYKMKEIVTPSKRPSSSRLKKLKDWRSKNSQVGLYQTGVFGKTKGNAYVCSISGIRNVLNDLTLSTEALDKDKETLDYSKTYYNNRNVVKADEKIKKGFYFLIFGMVVSKIEVKHHIGAFKFDDYFVLKDMGGTDSLWLTSSCDPSVNVGVRKNHEGKSVLCGELTRDVEKDEILTAQYDCFYSSKTNSICNCEKQECPFILNGILLDKFETFVDSFDEITVNKTYKPWDSNDKKYTKEQVDEIQVENSKMESTQSGNNKLDIYKSLSYGHDYFHNGFVEGYENKNDKNKSIDVEDCKPCKNRLATNYGNIGTKYISTYATIGRMIHQINHEFLGLNKSKYTSTKGYKFLCDVCWTIDWILLQNRKKFIMFFRSMWSRKKPNFDISDIVEQTIEGESEESEPSETTMLFHKVSNTPLRKRKNIPVENLDENLDEQNNDENNENENENDGDDVDDDTDGGKNDTDEELTIPHNNLKEINDDDGILLEPKTPEPKTPPPQSRRSYNMRKRTKIKYTK